MKCTCTRRSWTFIRIREFFSCLSIASVDGKQHLSEVVFSALVGFFIVTKMAERLEQRTWLRLWAKNKTPAVRPAPYSPDIRRHRQKKVWTKCTAPVVPSFSLQWKFDESTKHYLSKMLLAINWVYWQAREKFLYAYESSWWSHARVGLLHWNPSGFHKRSKVGYFSNRVVLDLTERNANHIIPFYCHLPVSCRSLVDRSGSLESCKPQFN